MIETNIIVKGVKFIVGIFKYRYVLFYYFHKRKYKIENVSWEELVRMSDSYNKKDINKLYQLLHLCLLKSGYNPKFIKKACEYGENLTAKYMGKFVVVATKGQYKMPSFVIFIDRVENLVKFCKTEVGLGIRSLKIVKSPDDYYKKILAVKYIYVSGSGWLAENEKLFYIENNEVFEVADIPVYEVVSGWGAYKGNNTAEFIRNYRLYSSKRQLYLKIEGTVSFGENYKKISSSEFVYDDLTKKFKQISGLKIRDGFLSHTYSDLNYIKGNWFKKGKKIKEVYSPYQEW